MKPQNSNQQNNSNPFSKKSPFWTQQPSDGCTTKVINGQTYYWCHHCGRWNKTHTTKQHSGPKRMPNSKKKANNSINLNQSPSPAAEVPTPPSTTDHDEKVNALAAVMSDLASTASSSITNSDTQQPSSHLAVSTPRNRWT